MTETKDAELLELLEHTLKLSDAAVALDKSNNILGAIDYYDRSILNIDEVMNKLCVRSAEWTKLFDLRNLYDDRMELLRDNESSKQQYNVMPALSFGTTATMSRTAQLKKEQKNSRLRFLESNFQTSAQDYAAIEQPPTTMAEIPYWHLRNVQKSIEDGGFLSSGVFVPKIVWFQRGIKFSGLTAKSAAFNIIISLISNNVEPLYLSLDEISLNLAEQAFVLVEDELRNLQNHLAKPFPHVLEAGSPRKKKDNTVGVDDAMRNMNDDSSTHSVEKDGDFSVLGSSSSSSININSNNGGSGNLLEEVHCPFDSMEEGAALGNVEEEAILAAKAAADATLSKNRAAAISKLKSNPTKVVIPSTPQSGQGSVSGSSGVFSSMVSTMAKGMKKYTEIGYQRLLVALPSKLSDDEINEYNALIVRLCEQCQRLDAWFKFLICQKREANTVDEVEDISLALPPPPPSSSSLSSSSSSSAPISTNPADTEEATETAAHFDSNPHRGSITLALPKIEALLVRLHGISQCVQQVVVGILMKDLEDLLLKYLQKTRKNFSRMYWDDDGGEEVKVK